MSTAKKIVLAEDNSILSLSLKKELQKAGYQVFSAKNGKKAIELIEEHNPDIILTDIFMPLVSGLEVISYVRYQLKQVIPIIVFSSATDEHMIISAFNLGASDFISKPFSPTEMIIRVKLLID